MGISLDLMLWGLAAFTALWFLAVGASIGSFLNVVVYRVPRRMSLIRPPSHCPRCQTPIRRSDNLPVLGWLQLHGRCRSCGLPISARYPLIEAATSALFLLLAHFELFSNTGNLPGAFASGEGLRFVLWHLKPELISIYLFHLFLLSTLLVMGLITYDRLPVPKSLLLLGVAVGFLFPLTLPAVHPLTVFTQTRRFNNSAHFADLWQTLSAPSLSALTPAVESLAGLVAGFGLGLLITMGLSSSRIAKQQALAFVDEPDQHAESRDEHDSHGSRAEHRGVIFCSALIGLFLGWQAVLTVSVLIAALLFFSNGIAKISRNSTPGVTIYYPAAALLLLCGWNEIHRSVWQPIMCPLHPGERLSPLMAAWLPPIELSTAVVVLVMFSRWLRPGRSQRITAPAGPGSDCLIPLQTLKTPAPPPTDARHFPELAAPREPMPSDRPAEDHSPK